MYDRVRPGYPLDAVAWMVPEGATRVVDMGAGTGALTRSLLALGLEVVAVEPDDQMRDVLASRLPSVEVRAGRAEELPLEEAEADVVLGGQMWHWVDLEAATAEVARVLRPGGRLGLVWNQRDESVPWMAEFGALFGGEDSHSGVLEVIIAHDGLFEDSATANFSFTQQLARDDLVDFVASRSHVQVMDPTERALTLQRVAEFARTRSELATSQIIAVPYVTACWRATRT